MAKAESKYSQNLHELESAVNSTRAPEDVLNYIVENTAKALGAKGCSLMLLTPDRELLLHTAVYGLSDWYVQKGHVSTDKSISEALEGKPVPILDATEDERVQYPEQAKQEGIASILSIPMTLREAIIGVLRVYTAEPRHFTTDDIDFVGAVANLGAITLENTKLYIFPPAQL